MGWRQNVIVFLCFLMTFKVPQAPSITLMLWLYHILSILAITIVSVPRIFVVELPSLQMVAPIYLKLLTFSSCVPFKQIPTLSLPTITTCFYQYWYTYMRIQVKSWVLCEYLLTGICRIQRVGCKSASHRWQWKCACRREHAIFQEDGKQHRFAYFRIKLSSYSAIQQFRARWSSIQPFDNLNEDIFDVEFFTSHSGAFSL